MWLRGVALAIALKLRIPIKALASSAGITAICWDYGTGSLWGNFANKAALIGS